MEKGKPKENLGELVLGLVHEIKNPLNSIVMNLDLLEEELKEILEEEKFVHIQRLIKRIRRETTNLHRISREFLLYSRPLPPNRKKEDIVKFINRIIEFLELECKSHNIDLRLSTKYKELIVNFDPEQFGRVLINLIINAKEAIKKDGYINIELDKKEDVIIIKIKDSGGGIPPEIENKIFDSFFTTKPGGTGLGLGIARKIVEQHGGRIYFINHYPNGLEMIIEIPIE